MTFDQFKLPFDGGWWDGKLLLICSHPLTPLLGLVIAFLTDHWEIYLPLNKFIQIHPSDKALQNLLPDLTLHPAQVQSIASDTFPFS